MTAAIRGPTGPAWGFSAWNSSRNSSAAARSTSDRSRGLASGRQGQRARSVEPRGCGAVVRHMSRPRGVRSGQWEPRASGPLPFRERACQSLKSSNSGSLGRGRRRRPSHRHGGWPESVDLGGERLHDRLHLVLGRAGVRADLLPRRVRASSTILRSCARAWPMRSRASRLTSSTISSATSCAWLNSWTTWSFTRSPTCSYSSSSACTRRSSAWRRSFSARESAEFALRGLHLVGQQVEVARTPCPRRGPIIRRWNVSSRIDVGCLVVRRGPVVAVRHLLSPDLVSCGLGGGLVRGRVVEVLVLDVLGLHAGGGQLLQRVRDHLRAAAHHRRAPVQRLPGRDRADLAARPGIGRVVRDDLRVLEPRPLLGRALAAAGGRRGARASVRRAAGGPAARCATVATPGRSAR